MDKAPDTLLRSDGKGSDMRAKFEKMIRKAQNEICAAIEAADGADSASLALQCSEVVDGSEEANIAQHALPRRERRGGGSLRRHQALHRASCAAGQREPLMRCFTLLRRVTCVFQGGGARPRARAI